MHRRVAASAAALRNPFLALAQFTPRHGKLTPLVGIRIYPFLESERA